jgi:hypothetical protein
MTAANELRTGLLALAKRSVAIMTACANVESTKLYLVLPFLGLLGYDYMDPFEVYPDHIAPTDPSRQARADFAILRHAAPVIAVACRRAGTDLFDDHGTLRRYFEALPEVRLAILTNGVRFEFYVDATTPGIMDDEAFLTLDLETIARTGIADATVETLLAATKAEFDPDTIAEAAHVALIKQRLHAAFIEEARGPSEAFCRFALERIGLKSAPKRIVERYYAPLIKSAFEETIATLSVATLRNLAASDAGTKTAGFHQLSGRIGVIDRELFIVAYVRRRLAYLVESETQYRAIDTISAKNYVGRLVVFVGNERKGRLFEYVEGADGDHKFVFSEPYGAIVTSDLGDIDAALKVTFEGRLRELGGETAARPRARTA